MDISGNIRAPIATAIGLVVTLSVGVAFSRTIRNYWEFKSLETLVFQPTPEYIEDSIEDDKVVTFLDNRGRFRSPKLFMITGVIIARGANMRSSDVRKRRIQGIPGADMHLLPTNMSTSASVALVSFAIDVAQQLRSIAHELSQESGIKPFCSCLAAELSNIHQGLGGELDEDIQADRVSERRLSKVLDNLERLCQVKASIVLKVSIKYSNISPFYRDPPAVQYTYPTTSPPSIADDTLPLINYPRRNRE
ncbi:hypothetical protein G7Z17_g2451 [Cylindrodendrum hubeiense]|uniref:Uncharacterized protein n=1 Tax=Cylindrodendrum hubeiense TaxID=595255 RepID=A0A9P5HJP6_9HYPO|nr:hypothetical protein G7Z17_g2451 [Cylindrodendrum hubeiense]